MIITLTPQRRDDTLTASLSGEVLTLNGAAYDFGALGENTAMETGSPWIAGPVIRSEGEIALTLILPCPEDAPDAMRYPSPIRMTADGPVPLPAAPDAPEEPE